jgi:PAS domain S-box-containing protein
MPTPLAGRWPMLARAAGDDLAGDARDGASVDFAALARRAQAARELQVSDRVPLRQAGGYGVIVAAPAPAAPGGVVLGLLGLHALSTATISLLEPRGVDLLIEDASAPTDRSVLGFYASRLGSDAVISDSQWREWRSAARDRITTQVDVADRRWTLTCSPTVHYRSAEGFRQAPWIMLAGGLGLTLLTALLVHSLAAQVRERLRVEQALRASEQRLRVVFNQSPDILMAVNEQGRIVMVNRPWPKAPDESAVGHNSAKILPKGLRKWYRRALKAVFTSGEAEEFQYSATDSVCWQVRIVPLRNAGRVEAAMVIATDVTEHRMLEAQAIRSARLATLGVLSASVAHEINNPNNAIQFNAAVLKRCFDDILPLLRRRAAEGGGVLIGGVPIEQAIDGLPDRLAALLRNSQRIQGIVASLKQMARHDPGEYAGAVDVAKVLRSAYSLVQHQVQRYTDDCEVVLPPALPLLRGNSQQLEQVFINLLLNALQALPERSASVRIEVSVAEDRNQVEVAVVDQGCGIEESDLACIFDPFFTTRVEQGGTGLGLSICRRIVENHGGSIDIESVAGVGTEVLVRLPVADSQTARDLGRAPPAS